MKLNISKANLSFEARMDRGSGHVDGYPKTR